MKSHEVMRVALYACISFWTVGIAFPSYADEADSPVAREARWQDIMKTIFGDKTATPKDSIVSLDVPQRAEDAALVPITITLKGKENIKELYLVIDDNPSPVAAHYIFGPAADPRVIKMRVRVNSYTNVHAVAKLQDGTLFETAKFVKAAGGCSAPMGTNEEEAMKGMGDMRVKFAQDLAPEKPTEVTLMMRHPNFNGMQMNQATRYYTPARYIDKVTVSDGDKLVFDLSTSISMAANPVISFGLSPQANAQLTVTVHDSEDTQWQQSFSVPVATN
jgi:sulfur-oxidizing protein SoxY